MKILVIAFLLSMAHLVRSQTQQKIVDGLSSDDSSALATIAIYADSLRIDLLKACQAPELLIKTAEIQNNSSKSFRQIMDKYPKEEQENLWNLARYPELLSKIVEGGNKSKEQLNIITNSYPPEIQKIVIEYGRKHMNALNDIHLLSKKSNEEFDKLLATQTDDIKKTYHTLIRHPDVLSTLSSNIRLSNILGKLYKSDPEYTRLMLESMKIKQEMQRVKETEEWKNGLDKNPDAKKEMEQVAKEFIKDYSNDINDDDIYNTTNEKQLMVYNEPPTIYHPINPYPYWFGYPWWYDFPYWYPYPYWYNFGFYWNSSGVAYMSLPSPFFIHWYFFNPHHHYYYPHFSEYCISHHETYYGSRIQQTAFNSEIHAWKRANEPNLPMGYFKPDNNRKNRIQELGRFEMNYLNSTKSVFGRNISRSDFLQNNSNFYPHVNPVIKQPQFNNRIRYPKQKTPTPFNLEQPVTPQSTPINKPKNRTDRPAMQKNNTPNKPRKR